MSNNHVISVEPDVFRGHPIRDLAITDSNISHPVPLTHIRYTVVYLSLMDNKIRFIPYDYFRGCGMLRRVCFSRNRISSFPELGYISETLHELRLDGNNLSSVDFQQNVTFPILEYLFLSFNFISSLDIRFISWMPSLTNLRLSTNNITRLQNLDKFAISTIRMVFLGENPWHCAKNLSWMLKWERIVTFTKITTYACYKKFTIYDMEDVRCHSPGNLKGMHLMNIRKSTHHQL